MLHSLAVPVASPVSRDFLDKAFPVNSVVQVLATSEAHRESNPSPGSSQGEKCRFAQSNVEAAKPKSGGTRLPILVPFSSVLCYNGCPQMYVLFFHLPASRLLKREDLRE